jgi:DNA-binding MarR family transcriptional regulator
MPLLMLKDLPRYECLLQASEEYPSLDPAAFGAYLNLLRTGDEVFDETTRFLTKHHVSQGRFTVLMLLQRQCDDPCTPASLADEARVARATMTGLIDTLEKDGLVIRKADENDRRTVRLHLTRQGKAFVKRMLPDYFRCVSAIIKPLNAGERKEFVRLLQKIQQGLPPLRNATDERKRKK